MRTRVLIPVALAGALLAGCSASSSGGDAASGIQAAPRPGSSRTAIVERVIDGDTIVVNEAGRHERVRLSGIDTPETVKPGGAVECYGPEASHKTTRLLDGHTVRLEFDVDTLDRYGRQLAYVFRQPDGLFIDEALIRGGFAERYRDTPNQRYRQRFVAAQRAAQKSGTGLWGAC